ncbi:MAG: hypothetical protein V4697_03790 [Patescibacteria group bacterium]
MKHLLSLLFIMGLLILNNIHRRAYAGGGGPHLTTNLAAITKIANPRDPKNRIVFAKESESKNIWALDNDELAFQQSKMDFQVGETIRLVITNTNVRRKVISILPPSP